MLIYKMTNYLDWKYIFKEWNVRNKKKALCVLTNHRDDT